MRSVRRVPASVPTSARVTVPRSGRSSARTASRPSRIEASTASACGRKARPASVSVAPPRVRSNSGRPTSRSSRSSRRLTAGCERCSDAAARVKPPRRTMATNASTWSISTTIRIADGHDHLYALDTSTVRPYARGRGETTMANDEFLAREVLGHGAYVCGRRVDGADVHGVETGGLGALAARLGLRNEFEPGDPAGRESIAFLRRIGARAGDIDDADVLGDDWVVHVASRRREAVAEITGEVARLLAPVARVRTLTGEIRPRNYTGAAMDNCAYGRQVVQQPGPVMPNAFLVPMSKTAEWWRKDWMERHTYFLPRYDDQGRMRNEGHALATEAGIAHLLRRTSRHASEPAPSGEYDFVTYFECSDAGVPVFHQVCAALRDVKRNPEWQFV